MGVDVSLTGIPNFDKLEVVKTGKATFVVDTPSSDFQQMLVPHNLGFAPLPLVYFSNGTTFANPLPLWLAAGIDSTNDYIQFKTWFSCSTDATNLRIDLLNGFAPTSPGGPYQFVYILLRLKSAG